MMSILFMLLILLLVFLLVIGIIVAIVLSVKNNATKSNDIKLNDTSIPLTQNEKNDNNILNNSVIESNKKCNFIIVDDASFMRNIIKNIIEEIDQNVIGQGENGSEAIKLTKELNPDIVILDIVMPEMDGIVALEEILKINPNVKVIMCSSIENTDMVEKSLKMGASDYILKPFNEYIVKEVIKRVIGLK